LSAKQREDLAAALQTDEAGDPDVDWFADSSAVQPDSSAEAAQLEQGLDLDVVVFLRDYVSIRQECRESSRPFVRRRPVPPTSSPGVPVVAVPGESEDAATQHIEDDPMPPTNDYTESPRQTALTAEEDCLLQQLIRLATTPSASTDEFLDLRKSLDDLSSRSRIVASTHDRGLDTPTADDHEEAKELLTVLGVPVVEAAIPYEAEGVASSMMRAGLIDWVGTEDSDVIAYEARILRNVTVGNKPLVSIDGAAVRQALSLDSKAYLDLMTLLGNDSIRRIYGVGPSKALEYLRKYGSIEGILAEQVKLKQLAGEGYLDEVNVSRQMFGHLPPIPDGISLEGHVVPDDEVNRFLEERHGLTVASIQPYIDEPELPLSPAPSHLATPEADIVALAEHMSATRLGAATTAEDPTVALPERSASSCIGVLRDTKRRRVNDFGRGQSKRGYSSDVTVTGLDVVRAAAMSSDGTEKWTDSSTCSSHVSMSPHRLTHISTCHTRIGQYVHKHKQSAPILKFWM
jgi:hypothetical protein